MTREYKVSKTMRTETAHRLMDYDGKCAHIHGHSYKWVVHFSSKDLDTPGIALDFKDLKDAMVSVIGPMDHALLLRYDDPLAVCSMGGEASSPFKVATNGQVQRVSIFAFNPTAEELAKYVYEEVRRLLESDGCANRITRSVSEVEVWETATSMASYKS